MSEEIKAPYETLEQWRMENVPEDVWENEYLQAYLKTRRNLTRLGLGLMVFISFMAGVYFRG